MEVALGFMECKMLVLSRLVNEKILIGDDIVVTVVSTKYGSVRLGIEAPPHLSVDREEIRLKPDYKGHISGDRPENKSHRRSETQGQPDRAPRDVHNH